MNGLDLFSGIGGLTKALEGYVQPVAYCEIEPYARGVLLSRMCTGDLPLAPIWDDVSTLRGAMLPQVDIIYGGFQPDARTGSEISDSIRKSLKGIKTWGPERQESDSIGAAWWATEPSVGRVANGVPKRVDRLRALGNAVVPAQAREAFERLIGLK